MREAASLVAVALALAVTLLVGTMQLALGALRLGAVANFVSPTVLLGFTAGAATLIAITFVAGLLPVVGNVISNTIIVVLSLAHSPLLALVSLGFLVTIHKLEYFLNARIIGPRIHAHAWELLLAILVMEAAFGLVGAIAAPVYYAWLKQELVDQGLV